MSNDTVDPVEFSSAGMINFVKTLNVDALGKNLTTVIILTNSTGSTDSEPIYMRMSGAFTMP